MAADEIVWQVINQQFCSYKLKTEKNQNFCRNEYNVTGFCNRQSCPLANSRYASVRADPATGSLYLYIKVPERTHLPSKWWERIKLSSNYAKALEQVDEKLIYWPKFLTHKCKQRLTRLTQVGIRMKRLAKEQERLGETLVPRLAPKIRRREDTRERKAEAAAKVERAIERELIERLRSGAYGDRPLNVEEGVWKRVMRGLERAERGEDVELEEDEERELEEEYEDEDGVGEVEYVSDIEGESELEDEMEDFDDWFGGESADEDEEDEEDEEDSDEDDDPAASESSNSDDEPDKKKPGNKRKRPSAPPPKARKKPARVEIEYETEPIQRDSILA